MSLKAGIFNQQDLHNVHACNVGSSSSAMQDHGIKTKDRTPLGGGASIKRRVAESRYTSIIHINSGSCMTNADGNAASEDRNTLLSDFFGGSPPARCSVLVDTRCHNSLFGFRNGSLSTDERYHSLPDNLLNCDSNLDVPEGLTEDVCQRIRSRVSSVSRQDAKAPSFVRFGYNDLYSDSELGRS